MKIMLLSMILLLGCGGDSSSSSSNGFTDAELLALIDSSSFEYYKDSEDRLAPSGDGHGDFRVLFNTTAAAALTDDGKLPEGGTFPEGSLIVKEIFEDAAGPLEAITVMLKDSTDENAAEGWIWGEYDAADGVLVSTSKMGSSCTSCHSTTAADSPIAGDGGNRDYVRLFGIYP